MVFMHNRRVLIFPVWVFWFFLLLIPALLVHSSASPLVAKRDTETEERQFLKQLKNAPDNQTRQHALTDLYIYYKEKDIQYQALSYLLKLLEIQKNKHDFAGLERSYLDLGEIYVSGQDYLNGLSAFFEALKYSERVKKNRRGYIYLRFSEVFRLLDRQELAWKYIKKALDASLHQKDDDLKVLVLSHYSQLYFEAGDYTGALKFINLSLKTEKLQGKYLCAIQCLYRKALILIKMSEKAGNHLPEVMALLKAAVLMGLKNHQYEGLLPVLGEYIEKLIQQQRYTEAAYYLDKIDDIYAPYYRYYFIYDYLQALFYESQQQPETALKFYQATAEKLEQFSSTMYIHQYQSFKKITEKIYAALIEFYLSLYNRSQDSMFLERAIYYSEIKNAYINESFLPNEAIKPTAQHIKTLAYFNEEKNKIAEEFSQTYQKYIRLLKTSTGQHKKNSALLDMVEKKLATLKKQEEGLTEFIFEAPLTFKKYTFNDLKLRQLQAKLEPWQRIIKYVVLERHIYAFSIDSRNVTYSILPGSSTEILEKVNGLVEPLDDFTKGQVDYLRVNYNLPMAAHLYDTLLRHLLPLSPATTNMNTNTTSSNKEAQAREEIFIIPDQQLFKLPFEALVTGFKQNEMAADTVFSEYASANYFIQQYSVSYALSLFHFQGEKVAVTPKRFAIVAFGAPEVVALDNGNNYRSGLFPPLPSSRDEILNIQEIFGETRSRLFLGERFTQSQFETYAPQAETLHIATHFINNVDHPQYSALLFSMCNNGFPLYYAHTIFHLKLDINLVVLSACDSSETHLQGMQGLRGITASFRHAGARALIVSMWPVDEQSAQLTPLFYRYYLAQKTGSSKSEPISPAQALRMAKLAFMKKTATLANGLKISFSHPFLWADYILYTFTF